MQRPTILGRSGEKWEELGLCGFRASTAESVPSIKTVFRGATKVTLDAKGRLAIPTRYRERIHARCDGQMVATVDKDYCLLIYPFPDWEEIERKLMRLPSLNIKARRLQRLMVGHAAEVDLDGHGRILLSRELREFASLGRQAMLIGQGNKFELWDEDTWNQKRDEWLLEDDYTDLSAELESLSL
jgi:MraZ protein